MKAILSLFLFTFSLSVGVSQHNHAHCGMSDMDQKTLIEFVEYYNKIKDNPSFTTRADKLNIPIKFHMVARSDGTGRIQPTLVLEQFEKLRKDFEAVDMNLYLYENSFNYLDNTPIYQSPGSASATVKAAKDPDALNIFITENADTPSGMGTVLGFYSPSDDYIIIRITDVAGATASLSHELGHMFSLPHTFWGWESEPYDETIHGNPVLFTLAPGSSRLVELVNGSNCQAAADRICDTPPDYNFGFGANGCNWNEEIFDKNNALIEPMIDNYMGYFIGCDQYIWTQGQIDIMRANFELNEFNGNDRSFLRSDYVPTSDTVNHAYDIITPDKGSTTDFFDYVLLDWDDAEGAQAYQLEINVINTSNGQMRFVSEITTTSSFEMTDLNAGEFVNWAVKPFNESYGGCPVKTSNFFAGTGVSATKDLSDVLSNLTISPNPVSTGQDLVVSFDGLQSSQGTLSLYDVTGRKIKEQSILVKTGGTSFIINTENVEKGLHLVKIETKDGSLSKKIIIN